MAIGENSNIDSSDKDKMHDIKGRIGDLTYRLEDIRREQVFQRVSFTFLSLDSSGLQWLTYIPQEREAEFRDQSESTNARVIRWIIIQLVILGLTCTWQLSHLRSFFIKQKLT